MSEGYRETLDYLYSLQFFGIKLGLENTRLLLERCGNPHRDLKLIHVAGTNGKGSTVATLASVFHQAGIRAGLYTSPHLHNFSERIRVDTLPISEAEIVALTRELRPHAEELRATFFEVTTVMALLHFQRSGAEWAILETGMGGRLDATNLVTPELCLLTPVALDHTQALGGTLAEVALEKAGILKPGVAALTAQQPAEVLEVFERAAKERHLPLYKAGADFFCTETPDGLCLQGFGTRLDKIRSGLVGRHQQQNLGLAAAAIFWLNSQEAVRISAAQIVRGLEQVRWPGRLEWLTPRLLIDGAHNPAGAVTLAAYLQDIDVKGIRLVVGCKEDKDWRQLLKPLLPFCRALYATKPPVDVAADPQAMAAYASAEALSAQVCECPAEAVDQAVAESDSGEIVVVAGSLFLVAAVREHLLPATDLLKISASTEL